MKGHDASGAKLGGVAPSEAMGILKEWVHVRKYWLIYALL
jgi:hypothetical protein